MKKNYPLSRKDNVVVQESDSEILIYDLNDNKAFCLNETSAMIWNLCDGNKSLAEISQELSKKLKIPADEGLVWLALEQLKKENLIEHEVTTPAAFAGMSRREVIKKVGLGTMIALPIVASLIAPTSGHAASCIAALAACTPVGVACCPTAMNCVNTPNPGNQCCVNNAPIAPGGTVGATISTGANGFCPGPGIAPGPVATTCTNRAPQCCSGATALGACVNSGGIGNDDSFPCVCV